MHIDFDIKRYSNEKSNTNFEFFNVKLYNYNTDCNN